MHKNKRFDKSVNHFKISLLIDDDGYVKYALTQKIEMIQFLIFFAKDYLLVCVKYVKYRTVIIVKYQGSISNLENVLQTTIAAY